MMCSKNQYSNAFSKRFYEVKRLKIKRKLYILLHKILIFFYIDLLVYISVLYNIRQVTIIIIYTYMENGMSHEYLKFAR